MHAFGGMQKERGGAGAGECGGDFLPDQARLSHAGDDDLALALNEQIHGLGELGIQPIHQAIGRLALRFPARADRRQDCLLFLRLSILDQMISRS